MELALSRNIVSEALRSAGLDEARRIETIVKSLPSIVEGLGLI